MFKKYLCLMLCVLLAFSTLSTAAFAADYTYKVSDLSASAVTFKIGSDLVIDLPTSEANVTATVTVKNSGASSQTAVFWVGKYVDDVLEDVEYDTHSIGGNGATSEFSATIAASKTITEGDKTKSVVLKAYIWTSTGKAIAKEAALPNIGSGLKFLKDGSPMKAPAISPAFREDVTDYTITLKRYDENGDPDPDFVDYFRMVSGDNTVTIVQPETYSLNANNEVTVTDAKGDETKYNFYISYEAPKFTWHDKEYEFDGNLLEYVEGDKFSPGDIVFVNRGGSEGGSAWRATAIGSELRGLDYIRGRYTSGSDHSATRAVLANLKTNGIPMLSFTPDSSGTIYVVFRSNYVAQMATYLDAENPPVGGVWTSLDVTNESVAGSYTLPGSAVVDYSDTATIENWIRSTENAGMGSDVNAPVNAFEPANMPYSFAIFSPKSTETNSGFVPQHLYTYAYKKDFSAGVKVDIPSPGSINFIPMYFIKWTDPVAPDKDNADIVSASYSVNSTSTTLTAASFVQEGTSNVYTATVDLAEAATISDFDVVLAEPGASMTPLPTESVTFETGVYEPKTVTLTTVTSIDTSVTKTYKIKFTIPAPDMTDASIASVSYNVGSTPATLAAADFTQVGDTNVYEKNVELPAGTTTLSGFDVVKSESVATVSGVPTEVTFATSERTKTVTFTITAGNGIDVNTYKINFSLPVTITWHDKEYEFDGNLIEYVEGDKFSPGDITMVNQGGSEGGTAWMATAIGSELKGLDYIRGRWTSSESATKTLLATLKTNGTPMLSFTANSSGTIYVVFRTNYLAQMATYLDAENPPVGGVWTALDVENDGHENGGSYTLPDTAVIDNIDVNDNIDKWIRSAQNAGMDANAPVNAFEPTNMPYSFVSFSEKGSKTNSDFGMQHMYTHAYKKDFSAGDPVDIPSPGSINCIPMYFIKWNR